MSRRTLDEGSTELFRVLVSQQYRNQEQPTVVAFGPYATLPVAKGQKQTLVHERDYAVRQGGAVSARIQRLTGTWEDVDA